jgi:hypothetical protein
MGMKRVAKLAAGCAALALSVVAPALAGDDGGKMRSVQGVLYWDGDPGTIYDPYWTNGQYKYDPDGYLLRNWRDPDQYHLMTAIGNHDGGKQNCVFRRRVVNSTWEFEHPILRICRKPPGDERD